MRPRPRQAKIALPYALDLHFIIVVEFDRIWWSRRKTLWTSWKPEKSTSSRRQTWLLRWICHRIIYKSKKILVEIWKANDVLRTLLELFSFLLIFSNNFALLIFRPSVRSKSWLKKYFKKFLNITLVLEPWLEEIVGLSTKQWTHVRWFQDSGSNRTKVILF